MTTSPPSSSDPSGPGRSAAFERLHERVRRWIWDQGWSELREVQERAGEAIFDGASDIVIAAPTAGGKTEAAFLPICSLLVGSATGSVRVLYVSPLKALINDQYSRLDQLCEHLEIPVHRWHGDVDGAQKHKVLREPGGILLITPESLEALLVLRGSQLGQLFNGLQFVVVDELHSFMGTERGRQLQSLLHRLELAIRRHVRRIGLSATLGDMEVAGEFLRPGRGQFVTLITSAGQPHELLVQVRGYLRPMKSGPPKRQPSEHSGGPPGNGGNDESEDDISIALHLFKVLRGSQNLIFANSRMEVESFADLLRRECERLKVPNEFWPHHGSLARDLRHDVEKMLKDRSRPASAVCTSTLELGIDIGAMRSIAQIGSPPSVASLRQRLGRSGRRDDPATLRIYVREGEITRESTLQDALRLQLFEAVAMVELLLKPWYEPPISGQLHLSTLVQQILSLIAQCGGVKAKEAWAALCQSGPFEGLTTAMFSELLDALGSQDFLAQCSDGTLLLGVRGERTVNRYDFYAAFVSPEEYRLLADGRPLGTLPISQPVVEGMSLVFAGRRWRVVLFDESQKVIEVVPSAAGKPPRFGGQGRLKHDRVRQQMFQLLRTVEVPVYLDATAQQLLKEGRDEFRRLDLQTHRLVRLGETTYLFPWRGDRALNTIMLHLRALDFDAIAEAGLLAVVGAPQEALDTTLRRLVEAGPVDAVALAAAVRNKAAEKYDWLLPESLLCEDFARRALDPQGAWEALKEVVSAAKLWL